VKLLVHDRQVVLLLQRRATAALTAERSRIITAQRKEDENKTQDIDSLCQRWNLAAPSPIPPL